MHPQFVADLDEQRQILDFHVWSFLLSFIYPIQ